MLGPARGRPGRDDGAPNSASGSRCSIATRLRLQKLVNILLDFSRIEAGRVQASYEPTDLAALTGELAERVSLRRSRRRGCSSSSDCQPLGEPVYVDREMWEKIVLNLVSNAFKFTLEGEIEMTLRAGEGESAELIVRDTGAGIPVEQLAPILRTVPPRLRASVRRTHEGTGIGLALVQELVKLHGGRSQVESVYGRGTTFTVTMPFGSVAPARRPHRPTPRPHSTADRCSTPMWSKRHGGSSSGRAEASLPLIDGG